MQVEWRVCPQTIRVWQPPKDPRKAKHHLTFLKIRADRRGIVWSPGNVAYICALGLEPTPEMFVKHMVEIFREVRRVLRPDGVCWLNLGDSYITKPNGSTHDPKYPGARCRREGLIANRTNNPGELGLKHKDLLLMPHRVALALQADGWHVRMDTVWDKLNPMPESVTDRPTRSHEYLFLLTKSDQYFYDAEAIKEPVSGGAHVRGDGINPKAKANGPNSGMLRSNAAGRENSKPNPSRHNIRPKQNASFAAAVNDLVALRNKRSVWRIASEPFKGKHYATFPKKLVEPCILAGTSARGCCPNCGTPWVRVTGGKVETGEAGSGNKERKLNDGTERSRINNHLGSSIPWKPSITDTVGWKQNCTCEPKAPVPCLVLDPFLGSGTTAAVALDLGRQAIGIDLWEGNEVLIRERTNITMGLRLA
jgi:DNA modification methylase